MKIRDRYLEIRKKYNLCDGNDELLVEETLAKIWHQNTNDITGANIALYGCGAQGRRFMDKLAIWNQLDKIACIIDNYTNKKKIMQRCVIKENELSKYEIKLVWIASSDYRKQMADSIRIKYPNTKIIDPYQELEKYLSLSQGINILKYTEFNKYNWFKNRLKERRLSKSAEDKIKYTKKLVAGYFLICDWPSFFKEIDDCIEKSNEKKDFYVSLRKDVQLLIDDIANKVKNKKTNDCIVFLMDSLSKYDVKKLPYLNEWSKNVLVFNNYINEYATTKPVMLSLFTGWSPFEDKIYDERIVGKEDSELLNYLWVNNIKLKYLNCRYQNMFSKINNYFSADQSNVLMSEIVFNGICELIDNDERQLIFLHNTDTIHPPFRTAIYEDYDYYADEKSKELFYEQVQRARIYADKIFKFYSHILDQSSNIIQVVMGDHGINLDYSYNVLCGYERNESGYFMLDKFSPALMIKNPLGKPSVVNELTSTKDFSKILYTILKGDNLATVLEDQRYVSLEIAPAYDVGWLNILKKSNNLTFGRGSKGVIGKKCGYIHCEDQEEIYFIVDNEKIVEVYDEVEKNKIIEIIGKEIIEKTQFPQEIFDDELFKTHVKIYKEGEK